MSDNTELEDIDLETPDYPEPEPGERFYNEKHKLWEMRFGYQEDKSKSFEENLRPFAEFNYRRNFIKQILDMKTVYFYETGEII